MTAQVFGEDALAMCDGTLRAHVLEIGALPSLLLDFDQEGAPARAVAVVVSAEDAVVGLAKGQGEAVENAGGAIPNELVRAPVATGAEAQLVRLPQNGGGPVGADDQVGVAEALAVGKRFNGSVEFYAHAQRLRVG